MSRCVQRHEARATSQPTSAAARTRREQRRQHHHRRQPNDPIWPAHRACQRGPVPGPPPMEFTPRGKDEEGKRDGGLKGDWTERTEQFSQTNDSRARPRPPIPRGAEQLQFPVTPGSWPPFATQPGQLWKIPEFSGRSGRESPVQGRGEGLAGAGPLRTPGPGRRPCRDARPARPGRDARPLQWGSAHVYWGSDWLRHAITEQLAKGVCVCKASSYRTVSRAGSVVPLIPVLVLHAGKQCMPRLPEDNITRAPVRGKTRVLQPQPHDANLGRALLLRAGDRVQPSPSPSPSPTSPTSPRDGRTCALVKVRGGLVRSSAVLQAGG